MKSISLDSILLFVLSLPLILQYRISSGETPYLLFGFIFALYLLYFFLDIRISQSKNPASLYRFKFFLFSLILVLTLGNVLLSSIIMRHRTASINDVHDIILQTEAAIQYFLAGKNPYAETYLNTPLVYWQGGDPQNITNMAVYHFVMPPFYLLFSLPFYAFSISLFGFFDGRLPLIFLFVGLLVLAFLTVKDWDKRFPFLTLLALNPATIHYFIEGRSDIFVFFFLYLSLFLLSQKRPYLSSLALALAFGSKQSVWPILPFYLAFLLFSLKARLGPKIWQIFKIFLPFIIVSFLIFGPFFLWDKNAFIDSIYRYLQGTIPTSYQISGYGFSRLVLKWGWVKNAGDFYPFSFWQIGFGLPLMISLFLWQKRKNTIARLILSYGFFLFVFWYFSRYFNNSHLGYLSLIFLTGYFWSEDQKQEGARDSRFSVKLS